MMIMKLLMPACLLLFMGCSPTDKVDSPASSSSDLRGKEQATHDQLEHSQEKISEERFPSSLELLAENGIAPLEDIHGLRLKSSEFRVIAVRAALQDFVDGPTPAVSIQPPEQADYVQILRCPENAEIVGGPAGEELHQVLLGSAVDEEEIFNRNDFWGAAIEAGCKRISKIFSGRVFHDGSAPSGRWVYLSRACVLQRRLSAAEGYSSDGCSPFVNASPALEFSNQRDHRLRVMLEDSEQIQGDLDHVWSNFRDLLTRSSEAFDTCAQKSFEGAVKGNERRKKLSLLVNAIPAGIGILAGGRKIYENLVKGDVGAGAKAQNTLNNSLKWAGASLGLGYISFTVLSGAIQDGAEFQGQTCAEAEAMDNEISRLGQLMDQYSLQAIRARDDIQSYREHISKVQ